MKAAANVGRFLIVSLLSIGFALVFNRCSPVAPSVSRAGFNSSGQGSAAPRNASDSQANSNAAGTVTPAPVSGGAAANERISFDLVSASDESYGAVPANTGAIIFALTAKKLEGVKGLRVLREQKSVEFEINLSGEPEAQVKMDLDIKKGESADGLSAEEWTGLKSSLEKSFTLKSVAPNSNKWRLSFESTKDTVWNKIKNHITQVTIVFDQHASERASKLKDLSTPTLASWFKRGGRVQSKVQLIRHIAR